MAKKIRGIKQWRWRDTLGNWWTAHQPRAWFFEMTKAGYTVFEVKKGKK